MLRTKQTSISGNPYGLGNNPRSFEFVTAARWDLSHVSAIVDELGGSKLLGGVTWGAVLKLVYYYGLFVRGFPLRNSHGCS